MEDTTTNIEAPKLTDEEIKLNEAYLTMQTSIPRINYIAATLDRNALMRVFTTVAAFPFIEKAPKMRGKLEQELFILTLSVNNAKNTIMTSVQKEEIENAIVKKAVEESKQIQQGEKVNE